MPKILAVTDEMMTRASDIGSNASEMQSSQNQILKIFMSMGRDFSGPIPALMIEKMLATEDMYQGMNDTLNGYKSFLEDTARDYE